MISCTRITAKQPALGTTETPLRLDLQPFSILAFATTTILLGTSCHFLPELGQNAQQNFCPNLATCTLPGFQQGICRTWDLMKSTGCAKDPLTYYSYDLTCYWLVLSWMSRTQTSLESACIYVFTLYDKRSYVRIIDSEEPTSYTPG